MQILSCTIKRYNNNNNSLKWFTCDKDGQCYHDNQDVRNLNRLHFRIFDPRIFLKQYEENKILTYSREKTFSRNERLEAE